MKNSTIGELAWYGGTYLLICGIAFLLWTAFFVTPNVPPLWQQIIGSILLPFGLLLKIPANSYVGVTICMVLNTLFWALLVLIVRKRIIHPE